MMSPISCMCSSKLRQLEQANDLGGLIHLVNRIVHRRYQVFDITPVERGYEGFPQRGHDLARALICFVFALCYLSATTQDIVVPLQQGPKRLSPSKRDPSMASKEFEKGFLFWHQCPVGIETPARPDKTSCDQPNKARAALICLTDTFSIDTTISNTDNPLSMCVLVFARLAAGTFVPAVLANLKKAPFYLFGSLEEKRFILALQYLIQTWQTKLIR
jgi:hypothetical protein